MLLIVTITLIVLGGLWYTLSKVAERFVFQPPLKSYPRDFVSCTGNKLRFVGNVPTLEYIVNKVNNVDTVSERLGLIPISSDPIYNSRYTILYSHGNSADLSKCDNIIAKLSLDLNVNIVAYDYTGYGQNGKHGQCSESACYQDISNVYYDLFARGVSPDQIIVMGTSLGTGPTLELAMNHRVAGVILRSPYTSIVRVVPWIGHVLAWIPFIDIFTNVDKIARLCVPVYIVHGKKDALIPVDHSYTLASKSQRLWRARYIEEGNHDIMKTDEDVIIEDLREFIASLP